MIKDNIPLIVMALVFCLCVVINYLQTKMVMTVLGLQYVGKLG